MGALYAVTLAAGATVIGAQSGVTAFAAGFYPTAMRSTGLGWALGVGRLGSIVGPVLGAVMLANRWSVAEIFGAAALPALGAAALVALIARLSPAIGEDGGVRPAAVRADWSMRCISRQPGQGAAHGRPTAASAR